MKVKEFEFPSYLEWKSKNHKFEARLGEYYCSCDIYSWCSKEITYVFAVSSNSTPSNIYSETIFKRRYDCKPNDNIGLMNWYHNVIEEFNDFWVDYIMATYFE